MSVGAPSLLIAEDVMAELAEQIVAHLRRRSYTPLKPKTANAESLVRATRGAPP